MLKYFSEIGYVSDSRRRWSHGIPFKNNFFLNQKALQVLIHPEWWALKNQHSVSKSIARILK